MSRHLQGEIDRLMAKLLNIVAAARSAVEQAVESVQRRNAMLAQAIVDGDGDIDQAEVELEEECLKALALYQPVATNLRLIVSVLKINNDIERIGDLAVNIAERALFLCASPPSEIPAELNEMRVKALAMLAGSVEALIHLDATQARKIRTMDDKVDDLNRTLFKVFTDGTRRHPEQLESLLSYLSVGRHLERVADYATNIAEDIIYLVEGEIVRHKPTLPA